MADKPEEKRVLSRRGWFKGASLTSLAIAAFSGKPASAAPEEKPKDDSIPTLKYDLEAQTHWVGKGGSAKEATVEEFPVSQSIGGVSMRLDPGAIRELHWHALAAEWPYMLEGRVRTTVISPNGQSEISDFVKGDTWYFPRTGMLCRTWALAQRTSCWVSTAGIHWTRICPGRGHRGFSRQRSAADAILAQVPDMQTAKVFEGGTEHVVSSKQFPIQTTITAVKIEPESRRPARKALASARRRVAILREGPGTTDRVWFPRPHPN